MKTRVMVLVAMVLAWSVPACAMNAQQTYAAFVEYEKAINCKCVTQKSLEQAMSRVAQSVGAYKRASAGNTPLGQRDVMAQKFSEAATTLAFVSSMVIGTGNVQDAQKTTRRVMEDLRGTMQRK